MPKTSYGQPIYFTPFFFFAIFVLPPSSKKKVGVEKNVTFDHITLYQVSSWAFNKAKQTLLQHIFIQFSSGHLKLKNSQEITWALFLIKKKRPNFFSPLFFFLQQWVSFPSKCIQGVFLVGLVPHIHLVWFNGFKKYFCIKKIHSLSPYLFSKMIPVWSFNKGTTDTSRIKGEKKGG